MKLSDTQLPREKLEEFYTLNKEMQSLRKKPVLGRCMFWSGDCDAPPIGSHLIARSWLKRIADDTNQILQMEIVTRNLGDQSAEITPRLIGINNATTFPGFCERHDNEVFSCLEKNAFTASPQQLLTLRYRSVCREACSKYQLVSGNLSRAFGSGVPDVFTQHVVAEFKRCLALFAEKLAIETALSEGRNCLESFVVKFDKRPTVLVSSTIYPLLSFTGRKLEYREEWLTVSIIPEENGGWAVFSWSQKAPKNASLLVKSFAKVAGKFQTDALLNLIFEASENHAISPPWWASLTNSQRVDLTKRFARTFEARHDSKFPASTLLVPGTHFTDWQPIEAGYF